jgi:hypothetical protein
MHRGRTDNTPREESEYVRETVAASAQGKQKLAGKKNKSKEKSFVCEG